MLPSTAISPADGNDSSQETTAEAAQNADNLQIPTWRSAAMESGRLKPSVSRRRTASPSALVPERRSIRQSDEERMKVLLRDLKVRAAKQPTKDFTLPKSVFTKAALKLSTQYITPRGSYKSTTTRPPQKLRTESKTPSLLAAAAVAAQLKKQKVAERTRETSIASEESDEEESLIQVKELKRVTGGTANGLAPTQSQKKQKDVLVDKPINKRSSFNSILAGTTPTPPVAILPKPVPQSTAAICYTPPISIISLKPADAQLLPQSKPEVEVKAKKQLLESLVTKLTMTRKEDQVLTDCSKSMPPPPPPMLLPPPPLPDFPPPEFIGLQSTPAMLSTAASTAAAPAADSGVTSLPSPSSSSLATVSPSSSSTLATVSSTVSPPSDPSPIPPTEVKKNKRKSSEPMRIVAESDEKSRGRGGKRKKKRGGKRVPPPKRKKVEEIEEEAEDSVEKTPEPPANLTMTIIECSSIDTSGMDGEGLLPRIVVVGQEPGTELDWDEEEIIVLRPGETPDMRPPVLKRKKAPELKGEDAPEPALERNRAPEEEEEEEMVDSDDEEIQVVLLEEGVDLDQYYLEEEEEDERVTGSPIILKEVSSHESSVDSLMDTTEVPITSSQQSSAATISPSTSVFGYAIASSPTSSFTLPTAKTTSMDSASSISSIDSTTNKRGTNSTDRYSLEEALIRCGAQQMPMEPAATPLSI